MFGPLRHHGVLKANISAEVTGKSGSGEICKRSEAATSIKDLPQHGDITRSVWTCRDRQLINYLRIHSAAPTKNAAAPP
jgi:hypothetical protein